MCEQVYDEAIYGNLGYIFMTLQEIRALQQMLSLKMKKIKAQRNVGKNALSQTKEEIY